MFNGLRDKLLAPARRLLPGRLVRRFARAEDAAAAVEFALVAAPFLALLFAILETALVFFAGQSLEAAASNAGRLIMTGQAQSAGYTSAATFKSSVVCPGTGTILGSSSLFDCSKIQIDVKTYTDFASINTAAPITNGQLDTSQLCFAPGTAGSIEVVRFYYEWPIYLSLLNNNLGSLSNGSRLLVATAVFRNEPFGTTGNAGTCP